MPILDFLIALPVALAGLYLLGLAAAAVVAPTRLRRYLAAHASSAALHFLEMAVRIVVGISLVLTAPRMRFPAAFGAFGWLLIATSLVICLMPWQWHQRFGQRSLPLITERIAILAIGALCGGVLLLLALYLAPAPITD